MKDFERIVDKAWVKFQSVCDGIALELQDKIDFEFRVSFQPSDGPVIEHEANAAPLQLCAQLIAANGRLTLEDFLEACI